MWGGFYVISKNFLRGVDWRKVNYRWLQCDAGIPSSGGENEPILWESAT